MAILGTTLSLEAFVNAAPPLGRVTACADVGFSSPGGGTDPNLSNNTDCEDTEVDGLRMGDFGWRKLTGIVHAAVPAPGHELAGARVTCRQFSNAPRSGTCAPHSITTGPDGTFEFDVFVHDTDRITVSASRVGYTADEITLSGVACQAACPEADLVLTPHPSLLPWLSGGRLEGR
jgi:hypothetical protein